MVMKRGKYQKVIKRDQAILVIIRNIKADHPAWGYRRIWASLKYDHDHHINQKRVYRIMKDNGLLVNKNNRLKASRTPTKSKPRPNHPNQWWGIDMTKTMIGSQWVYIVICIDWYTKQVVGYEIGLQSKSWHWLKAVHKAVNKQCPEGARKHNIHLMSDNGCQPTSLSFMRDCHAMGIKQAFTSYNNPKGNADTERFMKTMKEELIWINEWQSTNKFIKDLEQWIEYYNSKYRHSTLKYKTPNQFEHEYYQNKQNTTLLSA